MYPIHLQSVCRPLAYATERPRFGTDNSPTPTPADEVTTENSQPSTRRRPGKLALYGGGVLLVIASALFTDYQKSVHRENLNRMPDKTTVEAQAERTAINRWSTAGFWLFLGSLPSGFLFGRELKRATQNQNQNEEQ